MCCSVLQHTCLNVHEPIGYHVHLRSMCEGGGIIRERTMIAAFKRGLHRFPVSSCTCYYGIRGASSTFSTKPWEHFHTPPGAEETEWRWAGGQQVQFRTEAARCSLGFITTEFNPTLHVLMIIFLREWTLKGSTWTIFLKRGSIESLSAVSILSAEETCWTISVWWIREESRQVARLEAIPERLLVIWLNSNFKKII